MPGSVTITAALGKTVAIWVPLPWPATPCRRFSPMKLNMQFSVRSRLYSNASAHHMRAFPASAEKYPSQKKWILSLDRPVDGYNEVNRDVFSTTLDLQQHA